MSRRGIQVVRCTGIPLAVPLGDVHRRQRDVWTMFQYVIIYTAGSQEPAAGFQPTGNLCTISIQTDT
jgi:hypothetical protein